MYVHAQACGVRFTRFGIISYMALTRLAWISRCGHVCVQNPTRDQCHVCYSCCVFLLPVLSPVFLFPTPLMFLGHLATYSAQCLVWHPIFSGSSGLIGTSSFRFRPAPPLPSPSVGCYTQALFTTSCQNMLVACTGSLWHGAECSWCLSSWDTLSVLAFRSHLHVFCLM